jgi:hypothetical protein
MNEYLLKCFAVFEISVQNMLAPLRYSPNSDAIFQTDMRLSNDSTLSSLTSGDVELND